MKIDNNVFLEFYNCNINYKIQEQEKKIKVIKKAYDMLISFLDNYKPYMQSQCKENQKTIYSFKKENIETSKLPMIAIDSILYKRNIFNMYYEKAYNSFWTLKKERKELKELKKRSIKKRLYNKIIKKFNLKISEAIVQRQYEFNMGYGLGALRCVAKELDNPPINWGISNKNKAALIKQGHTPYNKTEHEKAKKQGKKYSGKKWIATFPKKDIWLDYVPFKGNKRFKFELTKNKTTLSFKTIFLNWRNSKLFDINSYKLVTNGK